MRTEYDCNCTGSSTARAVGLVSLLLVGGMLLGTTPAMATSGAHNAPCIEQDPNTGAITCTANDVRIGTLEVVGDPVVCDPNPTQCVGGTNNLEPCSADADCPDNFAGACAPELIDVSLKATIVSGPERYDIALWINESGGSAQDDPDGTCFRDILTPPGTFPTEDTNDCDSESGPYANGDDDLCGDIPKTVDECANTTVVGNDIITHYSFDATISCVDSNDDGRVDTGACTSWSANPNTINCQGVLDAIPGQPSKCECDAFDIGGIFTGCRTEEDCDDGKACTDDVCTITGTTGTCSYDNNDLPGCLGGVCVPEDDLNPCTIDTCIDDGDQVIQIHTPGNAGTECRAVDGVCDVAETCTGTDVLCPTDGFKPSTDTCDDGMVCTATDGTEGGNDFCSGTDANCNTEPITCSDDGNVCTVDTCVDGFCNTAGNGGTECRAVDGVCDVAETCTGTDVLCPIDGFKPSTDTCDDGMVCTATDGTEGGNDFCSGTDANCNTEPITCSDDGNVCTVDTCVDGFCNTAGNGGTECRAVDGVCDVAETCTGTDVLCPTDGFKPSTDTCDDGMVCTATDGTEGGNDFCSGTDANCNTEPITCSDDGNVCTVDTCVDGFCNTAGNGGTECRAVDGVCDVAETCTGTDVLCPTDGFKPSTDTCDDGMVCTATDGTEGGNDFCSGTDANCNTEPITCSDDGNVCTVDTCVDGFCNTAGNGGTECRAVDGVCDVAETCTGTDVLCPTDGFKPSTDTCDDGMVCTATDGTEGGNDFCSGTDANCNTEPITCSDDSNVCTVDTCVGGFCNTAGNGGDECRESANACDPPEQCTGTSADCPDDVFATCDTICRSAGFWGQRGGGDNNYTQAVIDAAGGCINVCGVDICGTDGEDVDTMKPHLGTLGSALEAECAKQNASTQLDQAYRQMVAAALNCVLSGSDCGTLLDPLLVGVTWEQCNDNCALGDDASEATISACYQQFDCWNNGGEVRDLGEGNFACALGSCSHSGHSDVDCNGDFDPCLQDSCQLGNCVLLKDNGDPVSCFDDDDCTQENTCEPFFGNCHGVGLCDSVIDLTVDTDLTCEPEWLGRATGGPACRQAQRNDCLLSSSSPEDCDTNDCATTEECEALHQQP